MDKDEQAPNTPPEAPAVEKPEPTEAAPEIKITDEPRVEATQAPAGEKDVAAEMDKLLNEETAAPAPEPQPVMGKKHNHVAIIIILSLLVLIAVGFAIFEYLTAQNAKCDCPKCETVECNCENEKEEEKEATSSADYLYIGEWGVKIKIPEGLEKVGYRFDSTTNDSILISGLSEFDQDGLSEDGKVKANQLVNYGLVLVTRMSMEEYNEIKDQPCASCPVSTYSDDNYQYLYKEPNAAYSVSEELIEIEQNITQLIITMVSNPDNFSEI